MEHCVMCGEPVFPKIHRSKYYCSPACASACSLAVRNKLGDQYQASLRIKVLLKGFLRTGKEAMLTLSRPNEVEWISRVWDKLRKLYGEDEALDLLRCRLCGQFTQIEDDRLSCWWH